MMLVIVFIIHTDAFLKNESDSIFTDTLAEMLQDKQTAHQTDRLAGTAVVLTIQRFKSRLEISPIYSVRQLVKWVRLVQHVRQVAE